MKYKTLKIDFELNEKNEFEIVSMLVNEAPADVGAFVSFGKLLKCDSATTYFVNELNLFYVYLIKFLADNEIPFEYSSKNGTCSNVRIKINGKAVNFVNFHSKFGCEFGNNVENWELIEHAKKNGRIRNSIGADAYNEFLLTIFRKKDAENANHNLIRENFPILEDSEILEQAKRNVAGFQYCVKGWHAKSFEYDISKSYASNALNDNPVGFPEYFKRIEDVPASYFYVVKFSFYNCKIKKNGIDFMNVGAIGNLCLTMRLFDEFKSNYDCKIKIDTIVGFKTRKSMFKKFINKTILTGKQAKNNELLTQYNKTIGNAIIGYLGRNTTRQANVAKMTENGLVFETIEEKCDPIYLPAYLCILDHAKSKFIRTIRPFFKSIIYANTDGIISTEEIPLSVLNIENTNKDIGNFRQKKTFDKIFIECVNGYAAITNDGKIENVISGMSINNEITPEEYQNKSFTYFVNMPSASGKIIRQEISNAKCKYIQKNV